MSYETDLNSAIFFIQKMANHGSDDWLLEVQNVIEYQSEFGMEFDTLTIGYQPEDDLKLGKDLTIPQIHDLINPTTGETGIATMPLSILNDVFGETSPFFTVKYKEYREAIIMAKTNCTVKGNFAPGYGAFIHTYEDVDPVSMGAVLLTSGNKFGQLHRTQISAFSSDSNVANASDTIDPAIGDRENKAGYSRLDVACKIYETGETVMVRIPSSVTKISTLLHDPVPATQETLRQAFADEMHSMKFYSGGEAYEPDLVTFLDFQSESISELPV